MGYVLEACVDSVKSAIEAEKGGARRIELCANLVIGGTSPGSEMLRQVKEHTGLEVRVLLRPRFGDFCYNEYELEMMKEDTSMYRELGADGIVTGILRPDGTLHMEQMKELFDRAGSMDVALHRAFDMVKDPFETLEQAVSLGIKTILTSGQKQSAWEGRVLLEQLVKQSRGRIEILAGGGITPEIIQQLFPLTNVGAYHLSGKIVKNSLMEFRREDVSMGLPGISEWEIWETSAENIRRAKDVLKRLEG